MIPRIRIKLRVSRQAPRGIYAARWTDSWTIWRTRHTIGLLVGLRKKSKTAK